MTGQPNGTSEQASYCTWDVGFLVECGDEAYEERDGFPLCENHAQRHDALTRLAESELA